MVADFHNVTRWQGNARVMSVLNKFRHVQRFCKERGHKISFADVCVGVGGKAGDAGGEAGVEQRRAAVGRLREGAELALEKARQAGAYARPLFSST